MWLADWPTLLNNCTASKSPALIRRLSDCLTEEEDREIAAMIRAAAPDILWVGLSTPKQELWMYAHRSGLGVPVMVGVGAAFDIHSGRKKRAPRWMQEHGLEWMFRLLQEPRRLWRRYLVYGPEFAAIVLLELLGLKKIR